MGQSTSDLDGNYRIAVPLKHVKASTAELKCSLFGYITELVEDISTDHAAGVSIVNITLQHLSTPSSNNKPCTITVGRVRYTNPLINKDNPGSTTISGSSLEKMPR